MGFLKQWQQAHKFQSLDPKERSIVFYAEDAASYVHFEAMIHELTQNRGRKICYLTSQEDDPILETDNSNIQSFHVGSGVVRTSLFAGLKADVLVMTMPDLETFHIKRSKASPVHYVYVFHSMVSTHLIYRKGAFDHFDTIFCVGPHHKEEIRAAEIAYGLSPKKLRDHGYGRLDNLLAHRENKPLDFKRIKRILIAPSWGENCLLETRGIEIIKILLDARYHVTVRPHPMTGQKCPQALAAIQHQFKGAPNFIFEKDIRTQASLHQSHCMISDWSGAALEYAFMMERPGIFIDVSPKINNPEHDKISIEPLEVSIRSQIGEIVSPEELSKVPEKIEMLCQNPQEFRQKIIELREQTVFNVGRSGAVAAEYLAQIADSHNLEANLK